MFDIEDILSAENQERALDSLLSKRDGCGPDGVRISEFSNYWKANHTRIEQSIRNGNYRPGIAKVFEIMGSNGKRREIANINVVDRFIERLIHQMHREHVDPTFLANSFAYQHGKGTIDAAILARDYIAKGCRWLCEIDIKDFFGTINHDCAMNAISVHVKDELAKTLIASYLTREVEREGKIRSIKRGLLQGSSISPDIANSYLHALDEHLESLGCNWLRYADNIYVYTENREDAESAFEIIRGRLAIHHKLDINSKKSGIYDAVDRRVLGYDFAIMEDGIEVRKHHYQSLSRHESWHTSIARHENGSYHIVQDGIINKKDYSLLFENEDERHHIPVEVTDQINVYGSVTIAPSAMRIMSERNIRIAYFNDFGQLMGTYTPAMHGKAAHVFLKQCELYNNESLRLETARLFEIASIHNMRANLRYYLKKGIPLSNEIDTLTEYIAECKTCGNVEGLMLTEARARKTYYAGFSDIVGNAGFGFSQRTKQPPKDPCNALISFGNTVLYNLILQVIWKTSLDPKIGIVHATNRRDFSLNLDFADLFKPIIVDRTIFSLINRREIKAEYHFREADNGGVLLNASGKRIFLECFDVKLDSAFQRNSQRMTYRKLLYDEVAAFQRMIVNGEEYKPYKRY